VGGFLNPPTWNPPFAPINRLLTLGWVLTLTANGPQFQPASGGGGGGVGTLLAPVTPPSGIFNNYNPAGFGIGVGRLDIDTTLGNIELTGLAAGADAQLLIVTNTGPNVLLLDPLNGASIAANQFRILGQMALVQNDAMLLCYSGGSVAKWTMGG
jgi:hypothetical protein